MFIEGEVTTIAGNHAHSGSISSTTDGAGTAALFVFPTGIGIDDSSGDLLVIDTLRGSGVIRQVQPTG